MINDFYNNLSGRHAMFGWIALLVTGYCKGHGLIPQLLLICMAVQSQMRELLSLLVSVFNVATNLHGMHIFCFIVYLVFLQTTLSYDI
jgi:hypothetical protein